MNDEIGSDFESHLKKSNCDLMGNGEPLIPSEGVVDCCFGGSQRPTPPNIHALYIFLHNDLSLAT